MEVSKRENKFIALVINLLRVFSNKMKYENTLLMGFIILECYLIEVFKKLGFVPSQKESR